MEAAASITSLPANENVRAVRLVLSITDPEVACELEKRDEGSDRDSFAKHALRIGVLALRQASGALDAQAIAREGERMLSSMRGALSEHASQTTGAVARILGGYLDPASGSLPQRLERLTKRDGEIELLLAKHLDGDRSTVAQTLARKVGEESPIFKLLSPAQADGLVATLSRAIDGALRGQREELLRQFSLDRPDSALSRLVRDITGASAGAQKAILDQFSLECEGSAMRRLSSMLDAFGKSNAEFQSEVRAQLASFRVRREEAARSSTHGHSFEYAAGELLQLDAQAAGDVCERLAGTPGREGRKTGDYVVTLGPESAAPGARIAVECKADKGYSEAKALGEIALARKNRDAAAGVFVVARESAGAGAFVPLRRVGPDVLVVWDAEDPATDVYLKAALTIARALVVREHAESGRAEADVREIEQSVAGIERMVTAVDSVAHDAMLVVKRGTRIGKTAGKLREGLEMEVERLRGVVEGVQTKAPGA